LAREIGSLNVRIGLDASGFQNGIASLNREMRVVESQFKASTASLGEHGKGLDGLKLKSDSLSKQTEIQKQRVEALDAAHKKSVETKGADAKATQDLEIKLNKAKEQLSYMEQDLKKINKEIETQSSSWYKLGQSLEPVGKKMQDIGKSMESVGKDLTKTVTLPIVGIGTAASKAAINFESAFAGVKKTVDATDAELEKLEIGIRDMSKEIPASASAIAEVSEAAGQLGIEVPNILGFTRVMIDLGESTNLSSDQAATSLARLANITGMSQTDFDKLGSTIVALGNNLATTESEIVAMGLRLAGAGTQIGLSESQIMSFAGALSSVGIEAEAGGSAFSKVMIDMQLAVETGSDRLNEFASVAGMSANDFKQAFQEDAGTAIISFIEGLGDAEKQGKSAIAVLDEMGITEVRLRDALLRASGASDVFTTSLEIGTNAWKENTALTAEAEQRYETTASKIQIAKNHLTDAAITIGEILVPHLVSLSEKVKEASEWFSNLSPATQETIVKIGLLVAAIGPAILIVGKIISTIGSAITAFSTISKAVASAGGVIGLLTNPIGIAIAAITAIIAIGVTLYMNWDTIKEKSSQLMEGIKEKWNGIKESTSESWENVKSTVSDKWESVKTNTSETLSNIKTNVSESWSNVKTRTSETWENIKTNTSSAWGYIKGKIDENGGGIKGVINTYIESYKSIWSTGLSVMDTLTGGKFSAMANKVRDAFDKVKGWIDSAINKIRDWNNQRVENKQATFTTTIKQVFQNIGEKISNIGKNAQGTDYWRGGLTWVGEKGPELIDLPKGSKVFSNDKSMDMVSSGKVEHTGTIKVVGVNNEGELSGVVDIIMDQLRREARA
jgi:TP901 family phage tail tape measure protein